ncbi:MAG: FlgD immunoglobulin-like domain containing protein [Candidatus Tenebribacter davisii]|nr:FlgD immunoglobulin-like domain containing protein [Candidatus Tenebribacter davisii]
MKKYILIVISLIFSLLNAVDYHSATGMSVKRSVRDTLFYYHTNNDDQHWFGSNSWAVKFEFNEYYSEIDTLFFEAEGANIYIPGESGSDPLTIKLCEDRYNQPLLHPDSLLFSQTLLASQIQYQAWNYIPFSSTITDSTLWLVVDYPTNSNEQFISASAVNGLQSYFLYDGYYHSMYGNSYDSEFLFNLQGNFLSTGTDLDLVSIEWVGDFIIGGTISPKFTIKNNSDLIVSGSSIIPILESPYEEIGLVYVADSSHCNQVYLPPLTANETSIIDLSDSLMYRMPYNPSQYQFSSNLLCVSDSMLQNNSIGDEFEIFIQQTDNIMIENAVQLNSDNSNYIWSAQGAVLDTLNCVSVNYFADFNDEPFFNFDSNIRYNYYNLMGYPATIVGGTEKLLGYYSGYSSQLTELYNAALAKNTFINHGTIQASCNEQGNVAISYQLRYSEIYLFDDFINDLTIRTGVVENVENEVGIPSDTIIPVFTYIVAEESAEQFLVSSTLTDTVYFNMNEDYTTITDNSDNCDVVLWLQNDETKDIYYVNKLPFTEFQPGLVNVDEDEIPSTGHSLLIYPNPSKITESINIAFSLPNTIHSAQLKIYNIKGQLVKTMVQEPASKQTTFIWDRKNNVNKTVSSGIYLMQIKADVNGKKYKFNKKCLLIN